MLKVNISSRFVTQDIVSSYGIFDPIPAADSWGGLSVSTHYVVEQPAETVDGDKYTKEALISLEILTGWKTFRSY